MSAAAAAVQAAAVAALAARPGFGIRILDGASAEAPLPHAVIGDGAAGDWSATGVEGREVGFVLVVRDEAGRIARLHALAAEAEAGLLALSGGIAGGWRVVGTRLVRSRVVRDGARPWAALVEVRVRVVRGA